MGNKHIKLKAMSQSMSHTPNQGIDFNFIVSVPQIIGTVFSWNTSVKKSVSKEMSVSAKQSDAVSLELLNQAFDKLMASVDSFIEETEIKIRTLNPVLLTGTREVINAIEETITVLEEEGGKDLSGHLSRLNDTRGHLEELYEDLDRAINRLPKNARLIEMQKL